MKLFYSPGASSLSTHILLHHTHLQAELVKVNLRSGKLSDGSDYQLHPLGSVPLLQLDDGNILSECAVILQYLADQSGDVSLLAPTGSLARYQQLSWLNFIATEIHKGFSPLFHLQVPEDTKILFRSILGKRFDLLNGVLESQNYLMGEEFSPADAYLFTTLRWCEHCGMQLSQWPCIDDYRLRIAGLVAVKTAMQEEGLEA